MKSSAKKVELAPYDDLFSTEESRQDAKLEKVREIPLSELHPFKNHPFKVKDDEATGVHQAGSEDACVQKLREILCPDGPHQHRILQPTL